MKKSKFTLEYHWSPSSFAAEYPEDTENLAENCLEELQSQNQRVENLRRILAISQLVATVFKNQLYFQFL